MEYGKYGKFDVAEMSFNDGATIKTTNYSDEAMTPTGGSVEGVGLRIDWQNGALGRGESRQEPNGAFVETIIAAAIQRLEYFQDSRFKCRENALAITKLEEALHWLESRSSKRESREVEGTHQP